MTTIRGLAPRSMLRLAVAAPRMCRPLHVFLCIADHFEPQWKRPSKSVQRDRVARWVKDYPLLADAFEDSRGRRPQHTFFYPQEEYEPKLVEPIAELCRRGYGDMEVHLHHDHDTADGLREKLDRFTRALHHEHGMLAKNASGRIRFGFIHGNWALDNSRPDGRWCGVNNELSVLLESGCYADFTMPSAPDPCQTAMVNSIYYASDDPQKPKSHDHGVRSRVGVLPPDSSLLMVQGPLALNWHSRKWGVLPRLENGDLTAVRPPSLHRLKLWMQANIHVAGRPDWLFVKLHTHGAQEANAGMLLGEPMRRFHADLRSLAAGNERFRYYYVTARELAELVHKAERRDKLFETARDESSRDVSLLAAPGH